MANITIPLKETKPIDWSGPLRSYLSQIYGTSQDFSKEIAAFHNLRQDVLGASKNASGRDILYKYYGQLELLDLRIPASERAFSIHFPWNNLLSGEEVAQSSVAFEKAAVLFNLGAVFSHIAASSGEPKAAFASYQASAGVFKFISDNFLHAPSIDLSADCTKTLTTLMLAQAQHSFLNKAIEGNTKPGIVFKLAQSASRLYNDAATELETLHSSHSWGEQDWSVEAGVVGKYMSALSHYYYALHLDSSSKYGEAIAHMTESKKLFNDLKKDVAKVQQAQGHYELASEKLKAMERDNDLIYNALVPPLTGEIPHTDIAKPTPMDKLYPDSSVASKVVGKELFEKVVPFDVHEKASLYSEEKTQIMRREREKVEIADQELRSALEYMDLPRSANVLRHPDEDNNPTLGGVPTMVKEWAAEVANTQLTTNFDDIRQNILAAIDRAPVTPETSSEIQRVKQYLITGAGNDKTLVHSLESVASDIAILKQGPTGPLTSLFHFKPAAPSESLLDMDDTQNSALMEDLDTVVKQVNKLHKIEKERKNTFMELKDKLQKDDISSLLVMNRKNPELETVIFPNELAKFDPYVSHLDATIRHQATILNDVTVLWKKVLSSKQVKQQASDRENALAQHGALIDRFRKAYETWSNAKASSNQASSFYDELNNLAHSLVSNTLLSSSLSGLSLNSNQPRKPATIPSGISSFSTGQSDIRNQRFGSTDSGYSVPSAYNDSLYEPQFGQHGAPNPPPKPSKPF